MSHSEDRPGSFLRRWSQRKQAAQQALAPPAEPVPEKRDTTSSAALAESAMPGVEPVNPDTKPAALTDADMPDLTSLGEESDYSGFLSPRVSETLRRQALRKLFHLPAFNVTDGLNDYDEDYTSSNTLVEVASKLASRDKPAQAEIRETGQDVNFRAQDEVAAGTDTASDNGSRLQSDDDDPAAEESTIET